MNHSYPVHCVVHALQSLKPLGHQQIRELLVDRLHLLRDLEDPLFIRVRRVIVGGRAGTKVRGIFSRFSIDDSKKVESSLGV